ncbi:alpha/beta hydrolase [Croceicoccus sp. F390]|uniref:Alpha/beta hydrolase n=1 Tax=Croceicoccus esteveae TaxID=3075597 RepID=A0ABU2ZIY2_9SPHN|nr:alpha/beta hydrolase [Croceicoccus sp. F390]MDT0576171.1 alpha/beta hydrolase [Croceicoccus sp. F390]
MQNPAPAPVPATAPAPAKIQPRAGEQAGPQIIAYGSHPLQAFDFYPAQPRAGDEQAIAAGARLSAAASRPLIVFVHGGAWVSGDKSDSTGPAKIHHYTRKGYQFATINYRLLPEAEIEEQAADVAAAVAALLSRADTLGIDRDRVVLMGHSAGAHLAALVATDPTYLGRSAMSPQDIAAAVLIDGPAFDVPAQIADAGPWLGMAYTLGFGNLVPRQRALSPVSHTQQPNARAVLMVHVERDSARQARLLADALRRHETPARVLGFAGRGMQAHNAINYRLGRPDEPATGAVDNWLDEVLFPGRTTHTAPVPEQG